MAVDKKSGHYTPPEEYQDLEGNVRTFTQVDHDRKPKVSTGSVSEETIGKMSKELKEYRKSLESKILALPASVCPYDFHFLTKRGDIKRILWDEEMVKSEEIPIEVLRSVCTIIDKKINPQD